MYGSSCIEKLFRLDASKTHTLYIQCSLHYQSVKHLCQQTLDIWFNHHPHWSTYYILCVHTYSLWRVVKQRIAFVSSWPKAFTFSSSSFILHVLCVSWARCKRSMKVLDELLCVWDFSKAFTQYSYRYTWEESFFLFSIHYYFFYYYYLSCIFFFYK